MMIGSFPGGSHSKRPNHLGLKIGLGIAAGLGGAAIVALRKPPQIGHWNDEAGHKRYLAAYDSAFAYLPDPAETLDIGTDFGTVRVYRFTGTGDAKHPLVLLPGRASATPVWADNLPSLLEIADVYTIDLLGEPGKSVQERPLVSDADQAAWLRQVLAALPEPSFHLVGLSIGGWDSVNLALHTPDCVASITLLDAVFVFAAIPFQTLLRTIPISVPWAPKSWRDSFSSYTAGGIAVEDEPVADMIEAGMAHYSIHLPTPIRITEDQLASLRPPVLAIIAGRSVMHDANSALKTAKRALPNATVRHYPAATHAINGEYPDAIARDIGYFVSKHENAQSVSKHENA